MKRFACALLALLMTLGCLVPCFTITGLAAGASLSPKKIVSVVVDNSGSMKEFWQSSNYALQTFVALLNEGDELYVTYMSEALSDSYYEAPGVTLDAGNIQAQVDQIRQNAHYVIGLGTPYNAVEAAFHRLQGVQTTDENAEYWLVILTDGEFSMYDANGNRQGGVSKETLGDNLVAYSKVEMPNGTTPQVCFLAIGSDKYMPTFSGGQPQNLTAKLAYENTVTQVISEIANAISGRSRFSAVERVNEKTLRVQTDIPLMNLSLLVQNSEAKVVSIAPEKGSALRQCRTGEIQPRDSEMDAKLNARAYLYDNNSTHIPAGTYTISFDKAVAADDVVVMFEPALELRATLTLNGSPVADTNTLAQNALIGDKLSVECKIYERGTDNEIKPSKLKDTIFAIEVQEADVSVRTEKGLSLEDYSLSGKETRIIASMTIGDFNPITWSTVFTPVAVKYTVQAYADPEACRLHIADIGKNTDVKIVFTVLANGVPMTDPAAVKALNPTVITDDEGEQGSVAYAPDGTIVYTPTQTSLSADGDAKTVTVTCTVPDGSDSAQYHILTSDFYCVVTPADSPIRKNEFYNNEKGVSFQLFEDKTRDGVQNGTQLALTPGSYTVTWEDQPNKNYELRVTQDADGTIRCTPYSTVDSRGPRWGWLFNGFYYLGLYGKDVTIVLDHQYARASVTLPVIGARFLSYLLPHVIAPTLLLFIVVGLILAYIIRYITKPRFAKGAVVYVGDITRSAAEQRLNSLDEYELFRENKFKNLWNPFKPLTVNIGGLVFEAAGTRIKCTSADWYSRELVPINNKISTNHPSTVQSELYRTGRPLPVRSIPVPAEIAETTRSKITPDSSVYYYIPDEHITENGQRVMKTGTVFCYFIQRQD